MVGDLELYARNKKRGRTSNKKDRQFPGVKFSHFNITCILFLTTVTKSFMLEDKQFRRDCKTDLRLDSFD